MSTGPLSIEDLHEDALRLLEGTAEGEALGPQAEALIDLSLRAVTTALDLEGVDVCARRALALGASVEQVHEMLLLVSGLGVHTLLTCTSRVADLAGVTGRLDPEREALWDRHVGDDPYWERLSAEAPGFLDALLRLSPQGFAAFFEYCALPWRSATVPAQVKELASMATDATPTHRYGPGMRLHLGNAVRLCAGRRAVLRALELAAGAPVHKGVR